MPFGAKPAPARGEGSVATATAQPSPPPGTFRRRGPQGPTTNRTSLAPGRERLPPRSAKFAAHQPVPWGWEGKVSTTPTRPFRVGGTSAAAKGRTFTAIRQRFTSIYRENRQQQAQRAVECGSLLPLSSASLLALGRTDAHNASRQTLRTHESRSVSRHQKTHRQQAGWQKRQQAAALQDASRPTTRHRQLSKLTHTN